MIKILESIRDAIARPMGKYPMPIEITELISVTRAEPEAMDLPLMYRYKIGVGVGGEVQCSLDEVDKMKEMLASRVAHILYGEIVGDLLKLRVAIAEKKPALAQNIIERLLNDIRC